MHTLWELSVYTTPQAAERVCDQCAFVLLRHRCDERLYKGHFSRPASCFLGLVRWDLSYYLQQRRELALITHDAGRNGPSTRRPIDQSRLWAHHITRHFVSTVSGKLSILWCLSGSNRHIYLYEPLSKRNYRALDEPFLRLVLLRARPTPGEYWSRVTTSPSTPPCKALLLSLAPAFLPGPEAGSPAHPHRHHHGGRSAAQVRRRLRRDSPGLQAAPAARLGRRPLGFDQQWRRHREELQVQNLCEDLGMCAGEVDRGQNHSTVPSSPYYPTPLRET